MFIELLDHTPNPELAISLCSAECYNGNIDIDTSSNRLDTLIKNKHYSTYRFAYATFRIKDISRVCSHQLVRIAHAGILQQSQRYVTVDGGYVVPDIIADSKYLSRYHGINKKCYDLYADMISIGIPREDARYILPSCSTTQLVITGNFQMWKHFLDLRLTKHAQWEIRSVAYEINRQLNLIAPKIFKLGEVIYE